MRRVAQHRAGMVTFTAKYRMDRLVLAEEFSNVHEALAREKQLKGWTRSRKLAVIDAANPCWDDLAPGVPPAGPSLRSG